MRPRLHTVISVVAAAGLLTVAAAWLDRARSTNRVLALLAQPLTPGPIKGFASPNKEFGTVDSTPIDLRWSDYGWPVTSMRQSGPFQAAMPPSWLDQGLHISGVTFPLRPLWMGFLTDVLFFSSALSGLLLGAGVFRSHRRRRAGRCPACGHPVAAAGAHHCTECGHALLLAKPA